MQIQFYLQYGTRFGQKLMISGNIAALGNNNESNAAAMTYLDDEYWVANFEISYDEFQKLRYKYLLVDTDNLTISECKTDRRGLRVTDAIDNVRFIDTWNYPGETENAFYTAAFKTLLSAADTKQEYAHEESINISHILRVKCPLLAKEECICVLGSGPLGNWDETSPSLLKLEDDYWRIDLDLSGANFPVVYKYAIWNQQTRQLVQYETGDNRVLHTEAAANRMVLLHDGFVRVPSKNWRGAGVSIPVFSLRSERSFGTGEFTDLKLMTDWASAVGISLIQLLPVNDSIATKTWTDSYPYAAISAFALHPLYINLEEVAGAELLGRLRPYQALQKQLNSLPSVDYEQVMEHKMAALAELYELKGIETLGDRSYLEFYSQNKHWLLPYAAFSVFRDRYKTANFETWPDHNEFNEALLINEMTADSRLGKDMGFYYFIQYQLHLQLKEATSYAHSKSVVIKGDIPIGVYRYSCDTWMNPSLYHMDQQAGAPPDDFAVKGQNWGFPTYNWERMKEDGYAWWRQRFAQMSHYFDAFRIDHILGFFRIWSIPIHAVEGIMGRFVPAIPVRPVEFGERGIWFDEQRYCNPYITDEILNHRFGPHAEVVRNEFLTRSTEERYVFKPELNTQKAILAHFKNLTGNEVAMQVESGLLSLLSDVILFKDESGDGYHFRIDMEKTDSFSRFDFQTQQKLKDLAIDYFFRRQDERWRIEALEKLPSLKETTDMLICGEDLGMVPACVPAVMRQLGLLSLEIQRMPKDSTKEFFLPAEAPYLSVITPSTHDMSTIRGWWEEDRAKTQRFFNNVLHQQGDAPYYCEAWINRAIVMQHLYSSSMWSIFQWQDILGMSETLRRENPHDERINVPANPQHYWRYRMHMTIEALLEKDEFNREFSDYIFHSGRSEKRYRS